MHTQKNESFEKECDQQLELTIQIKFRKIDRIKKQLEEAMKNAAETELIAREEIKRELHLSEKNEKKKNNR